MVIRTRSLTLALGVLLVSVLTTAARAHVVPGVDTPHAPPSPGLGVGAERAPAAVDADRSPARCGPKDKPEPGIQGDVPGGGAPDYSCGLTLVSRLPVDGPVQGSRHCVYVRTGGPLYGAGSVIRVFDMRDPARPRDTGKALPTYLASETMRAVTTRDRAVLVQGGAVYDIRDCENPVLKGHIEWNPDGARAALKDSTPRSQAHDIRISPDAKRVYASYSLLVADISDLDDPSTWTARDHTCALSAQYHPVWRPAASATGDDALCDELWRVGESPHVSGSQSHAGPEENDDGTRVYIGGQIPANDGDPRERDATLRVLDMTKKTPRIIGQLEGPGHSVDWFRIADGRQFLLHANEIAVDPTSCLPHPRPAAVGFANEAFLTEVSKDQLRRASLVELAISKPEHCRAKIASGQSTSMAYHSVDDRRNARFAMIPFGRAGLRIFDIRDPDHPAEVAYFNQGSLNHAGVSHYDAARGLIYAPVEGAVRVLKLQPQVRAHLGLDGDGRAHRPSTGAEGRRATREVIGIDHGFEGLPHELAAGTQLTFTNGGEEPHELTLFHLPQDEERTVEELIELPREALQAVTGEPLGTNVATRPGQPGSVVQGSLVLRESGRHLALCRLPVGVTPERVASAQASPTQQVGVGPPHFTRGMAADFTVP